MAVAVITVMAISIRANRENTDQLQTQMAQQRLEAAKGSIERYLTPAADDVSFLAEQLSRRGGIPLNDDPQITTLMRGSLGSAPQIDGLAFVRSDFSSVRMRRDRDRDRDQIDSISGSIDKQAHSHELIEAAKRVTTPFENGTPSSMCPNSGSASSASWRQCAATMPSEGSSSPRCRWRSSQA